MKIQLLIVMSVVIPTFLVASDIESDSPDEKETVEQDTLLQKSMFTSVHEKLQTPSLTDEHRLALHNASIILAGLCTTFGNAIGRLLLMGFFTHKSFKNLRKLLNEDAHRSEHAAKTVCYFVAMLLLAQDGYAWLLKQNNAPIV